MPDILSQLEAGPNDGLANVDRDWEELAQLCFAAWFCCIRKKSLVDEQEQALGAFRLSLSL